MKTVQFCDSLLNTNWAYVEEDEENIVKSFLVGFLKQKSNYIQQ